MSRSSPTFHRWAHLITAASAGGCPCECPSCGERAVWAVFVGDPRTRIGYAMLWCEACLRGIHASRLTIPASAELVPFDTPREQWPRQVPSFTHVKP